ncbi:ABC transporter ATP-binding protein [Tropicimonas sediminicola]|uniref:Branched-chain amino acid transport system ATP-binding protein n=1 Tax=Tropicimonas sediminicola TaxID=1031541 RepID=A0A239MF51_9RHOB|nr:ABC transporter ATP-binding protein [Tropicimonas sediminicola]SNT40762.1 branched-chain amino acid transport system ATP-binding protein [Tropicimonas sediminicola]
MKPVRIEVDGLTKKLGGVAVVNNVSFQVDAGQIMGLIGPNGAGKTTMFNLISGVLRPDAGKLRVNGRDVTGLPPYKLARHGIVRSFQLSRELDRMSVLDNVLLAAADHPGEHMANALFRPFAVRRAEAKLTEKAREMLALVALTPHEAKPAGTLSGGQKKLLELARALMAGADTILLDEIAAGVAPHLVEEIIEIVQKLNRDLGKTFLIIEHNVGFIRALTSRVVVMAAGELLAEGSFDHVSRNPAVIDSYLGQAA